LAWITQGSPANNTVYQRTTKVCTFLRWCLRAELIDRNPAEHLREQHSPLRTFTRTYGKVQARNPGRWLTHDEAFGTLVPSCNDGTVVGVRDEIVLRLGLAGMRLSEIASLRMRNVDRLPTISWTGKGSKPRTMTAGSGLIDAIGRYLAAYPDVRDDDPLICRLVSGASRQGGPARIDWHVAASNRILFDLITKRARACGLGHVAPHDLRRTAAGILHRATNDDGAHYFDLLDIQKVLGHSDPATTMRSYLAPMDTDVYDRAASILD
jgi:integrase